MSSNYMAIAVIGSLVYGPPAAELIHEKERGNHAAVLPGGVHEHPIEEQNTRHVGEPYNVFFTSSSAAVTVHQLKSYKSIS